MKWSTAEARGNLSKLLHAADEEPQIITNRGRPVAVVVDAEEYEAFRRWRESRPSATLADTLDDLARVCEEDGFSLAVPPRRDRPSGFAEGTDGQPG